MQVPIVMTLLGKDRPGLVEAVASLVTEQGGNWVESRMAHLAGQFAGILRITVPAENQRKLEEALRALGTKGLQVQIEQGAATAELEAGRSAVLKLIGQDRPGIVRQISHAFARHHINVEELETECTSAPMSGETLFHATARVRIPAECEISEFEKELDKIAADLMADVKFEPIS